ncbi:MAG: PAS-domain containing protein, partial [Rhodospirillaceae bacterium]
MSFEQIQARVRALAAELAQNTEPATAAAVVAVLAALLFLGLYLGQRRRLAQSEHDRERLTAVATRAKEILATAPDGLFLWDHILGGITCSRRLAVLLGLEAGTQARYDDIRACFEGESLKALERSVTSLRGNGTPFGILVTAGRRTLEAVGARAETELGHPVADIVWMRDVTELRTGAAPVDGATAPAATPTSEGANASGLDDRHLTALLNAMPIPIWLRDSGLNLAFVNTAANGVVDPTPKMAETARRQGGGHTERRLLDVAGRARLMDVTEIPLGASGDAIAAGEKPGGSVGFAIDRTEREEAESELKRQTQARDAVLANLGSAIAIFDADKRLDYANPAYAWLWGLDAGWLADKPAFGEVLDRQREARALPEVPDFRAYKAEQAALFTGLTEPVSELMHLPDGRAVRRNVAPQVDGGLVFAFDDVSERLGLERSVKEAGAVQRETLDNLSEGVAVFGSDGRLKLFNPVYARLWNLDAEALAEEPHVTQVLNLCRPLIPTPADAEAWTDEAWIKHRDLTAAQLLSRATTSAQATLANGTVIDYATVPLPDGAVLISYLDVTDTVRVEAALRERAQAFQEADRLKTEFIANVSYEVRTPLNTIIGFADMLSQNLFGELNNRQADYAQGILNTSRSLVSILGDILDLASIEAGRLTLDKDTFDAHAFLVASLNLVQARARRKNIRLMFDCPPDIGWMIGDETRLKQVLFNVLSNAVTFTPPQGEVVAQARRLGTEMEFAVHDTGVGVPAVGRERLFRPFERGDAKPADDDAAETSGTGLGLSIARNF